MTTELWTRLRRRKASPLNGAPASLRADDVSAGYHGNPVIAGINLEVNAGEIVALLGANGAGKTTTLLALAGALPVLAGQVVIDGVPRNDPLHQRAARGLAFIPEGRSVLMRLTVADNLRLGRGDIDLALNLFPELKPLLPTAAGLVSGGEQQMLTLARALSRKPRIVLADELSLGLAPLVVRRLLDTLEEVARGGAAVFLVEQQIRLALQLADRAYVMERGAVALSGTGAELYGRMDEIEESYLATKDDADRQSNNNHGSGEIR
jgi:branched-chain amino acid transport system ATP-binding protein